jgi:hypothetical protein
MLTNSFRLIACLSALAAACQSADDDVMSDAGSGGSGMSSPQAPKILALNTNNTTLDETDVLVISAVVTDPDGIGDLIGGQLMTADGTSAYGAFATDAAEGAYSLSLSWSAINSTDAINTDAGATTQRTFRATFFDTAGHSSYRDVTVGLRCSLNSAAACNGACTTGESYTTLDQCGSCNHACPIAAGGGERECVTKESIPSLPQPTCMSPVSTTQRVSCASKCLAPYAKCGAAVAYYSGGAQTQIPCSTVPAAQHEMQAFADLYCICIES